MYIAEVRVRDGVSEKLLIALSIEMGRYQRVRLSEMAIQEHLGAKLVSHSIAFKFGPSLCPLTYMINFSLRVSCSHPWKQKQLCSILQ